MPIAGVGFDGLGLLTNHPFDLAYQAAEDVHGGSEEADARPQDS